MGVARFYFSPHALWGLARDTVPKDMLDKAGGLLLAVTGLDLEKDLLDNFTGEVVGAFYSDPKAVGAEIIGTRDDTRTRAVLDRLDGAMAGGLETARPFLDEQGVKAVRTLEKSHGRPAYVSTFDLRGSRVAGSIGSLPAQFEVHLTTGSGALVVAFDRPSRERAVDGLGRSPDKFLSTLEPDVRRRFESGAAIVGW